LRCSPHPLHCGAVKGLLASRGRLLNSAPIRQPRPQGWGPRGRGFKSRRPPAGPPLPTSFPPALPYSRERRSNRCGPRRDGVGTSLENAGTRSFLDAPLPFPPHSILPRDLQTIRAQHPPINEIPDGLDRDAHLCRLSELGESHLFRHQLTAESAKSPGDRIAPESARCARRGWRVPRRLMRVYSCDYAKQEPTQRVPPLLRRPLHARALTGSGAERVIPKAAAGARCGMAHMDPTGS
jgi:hypothetical protein